jgi:hypothetical protein
VLSIDHVLQKSISSYHLRKTLDDPAPQKPVESCSEEPECGAPLALPNRSIEAEEIIRGLLAFFAERSSSPYSSQTTLQFLFSTRRASALSVGRPG